MRATLTLLFFVVALFSFKTTGLEKIMPIKVDNFSVDVLGNLYVVREAELIKYDNQLNRKATFTNLSLGDITSIDVSDAMNILVFYEDFAQVLFLDNTLSLKNSVISIADLGFPNASLACLSYNNGFWIFDPVNQELVRINQFLDIVERTGTLNQIIKMEIEPDQLFESGNTVYLKDRKYGIFIFDRYAGYLKRMPFLDVDNLVANDNALKFLKNDTLFNYNMNTLVMDTLDLQKSNLKKVIHSRTKLYYLNTAKGLTVSQYNSIPF